MSASARTKRILCITPFYWTIGEDAGMPSVHRTLTGLAGNGWHVDVVLPAVGPARSFEYRGLTVHTFATPRFGLVGRYGIDRSPLLLNSGSRRLVGARWKLFLGVLTLRGAIRALQVSGRRPPALIYGILPMGALAAWFVARRRGLPNVTRLFGTHLAGVTGLRLLAHLWEVAAFKIPAQLLIVTDDGTLGDSAGVQLGVDGARFRFLMNGVAEDFLRPSPVSSAAVKQSLALGDSTALFTYAHHLLPSHRPDLLVEAAAELIEAGEDVAVCLVGDGPERDGLLRRIRAHGLESRILIPGNVPRDRVRELMASSEAVVSLDELSNLVNSVLEALALGVPVVATATGGTRRLLEHDRDCLLVEPSSRSLADALRLIATDRALRARLADGARSTAANRIETWAARMERESRMLEEIVR